MRGSPPAFLWRMTALIRPWADFLTVVPLNPELRLRGGSPNPQPAGRPTPAGLRLFVRHRAASTAQVSANTRKLRFPPRSYQPRSQPAALQHFAHAAKADDIS